MHALRHHLLEHRWTAAWLIGLAMLMRIVVPAGYMPMVSGNAITVAMCSGYGPMKMTMAMPVMPEHQHNEGDRGKGDMPCGFSALSTPSLSGADPVMLAVTIAFIIATVFLAARPSRVAEPTYLRPPLRGPPASA